MDLRELEAVVAVHHHGSFSGAAAALFISQPALTRRVALLETELGLQLFTRTSKGAQLTEAGRVLIEPAEHVLKETEGIREALGQMHGGRRGALSLTGVGNVGAELVGNLIADFVAAAPGVHLRVDSSPSTAAAVASVEKGDHDLAIVDLPVGGTMLEVVPLMHEDYLAVYSGATAGGSDASHIPFATADLVRSRPMIHLPVSNGSHQPGHDLFRMLGVEPVSMIEIANLGLLIAVARGGQGIAVVPRSYAMQALADGAAVAAPPHPIRRQVGIVRRPEPPSPTLSRFLGLAQRGTALPVRGLTPQPGRLKALSSSV